MLTSPRALSFIDLSSTKGNQNYEKIVRSYKCDSFVCQMFHSFDFECSQVDKMTQARLKKALSMAAIFCVVQLICFWIIRRIQISITVLPDCSQISTVGSKYELPTNGDADSLWRPVNRVLADFRPELAERIKRLEAANTSADSPEVIELARDVIDGIPASAFMFPIKQSLTLDQTPQARTIDEIGNGTVRSRRYVALIQKTNQFLNDGNGVSRSNKTAIIFFHLTQ